MTRQKELPMVRAVLLLLVLGLLGPPAWAQTTRQTPGTIAANGEAVTLRNVAGMASIRIQTLDSYSGTWELQCSLDGTTFDADDEVNLTLDGQSSQVQSVTDAVGIWKADIGGCIAVRVIATAGFAASDTAFRLQAIEEGSSGGGGAGGGGAGTSDTLEATQQLVLAELVEIDTRVDTLETIFGTDAIFGTAGTADADVLTVQGVASMTPLLTTTTLTAGDLDIGNVDLEIGGTVIDTNAGVDGAQTIRVTEATDSQMSAGIGATGDAAVAVGATGSISAKLRQMSASIDAIETAVETLDNAISGAGFNISQIGGVAPTSAICDDPAKVTSVIIDTATSGNVQLVAIDGSEVVYVCGWNFMAGGTVSVQLISGTGTECATGETNKTGLYPLIAQVGLSVPNGGAVQFKSAAGEAVCIELSTTVQTSGILTYVQQ